MNRSLPLTVLAAGLVLAAVRASDDAGEPKGQITPPKFTCTLHKPKDDCAFSMGKDGVVLRIASESGIGSADFALTEGEAPRRLTIQFPKMDYLESFTIGDGKTDLGGSLGCDVLLDKQGKEVQDPKDAVYFLKIRKNKTDDRLIEVDVSLPCTEPGTKEWRLTWIDAFRK